MEAVIAGWLAGYLMGIGSTIALSVLVVRHSASSFLHDFLGDGNHGVAIAVLVFMGATVGWTMIGLVFGSAYEVLDLQNQPALLGSPSAPFLLAMIGLGVMALGPLLIIFRRSWVIWSSMTILFVGSFGWLLPILASR